MGVVLILAMLLLSMSMFARPSDGSADSVLFGCRELLGRPTAISIALNIRPDTTVELYVEYGIHPSMYTDQTLPQSVMGRVPVTVNLTGLYPNSRYYYRVRYRLPGVQDYSALGEHTFHTARPVGSSFVFAIEADPHVDTSTHPGLFRRTLANILSGGADFLIDLGDTFMSDKLPVKNTQEILARHVLLRSFFDTLSHSVPLMLVLGNHEGEQGWMLSGTANNISVWTTNIRKEYYPNPYPDGFYTGDTVLFDFVGSRQDYYAWEWGNALFVVLDPYWNTMLKPGVTKNNWDWTLGKAQYDWLKRTLETSTARYKFLFAHQVIGGIDFEGRGGIEGVPFYEMGGQNSDSTWGFDANRPGWGKPIHQLMVDTHVSAFFHGHDHVYVKQDLEGIVYQELPQPGYYNFYDPVKSYTNTALAAKYSYTHGVIYSSSGYLRVSVNDSAAVVDYVRSYLPEHETTQRHNGDVAYSYVLKPYVASTAVEIDEAIPEILSLGQNYPNPFNPNTKIEIRNPKEQQVSLRVYDLLGREIAVLMNEMRPPGVAVVPFDASRLSTGVYLYRLTAGAMTIDRKMILAK